MELLIIGIIIGVVVGAFVIYRLGPKTIGYLKVSVDEDKVPYLFLELDHDGINEIYKRSYVTLKVDLKSYNPQK